MVHLCAQLIVHLCVLLWLLVVLLVVVFVVGPLCVVPAGVRVPLLVGVR